jgi:ankyrin repeat protein
MFAAAGGNVDLVQRMITLGQDPRFRTSDGYDALAWAAGKGQGKVVEFLLPLVDQSSRALERATENGHAGIADMLRRAGYK